MALLRVLLVALVAVPLAFAGTARATSVDWTSALSLEFDTGSERPLVLFGLNGLPGSASAGLTPRDLVLPDLGFRELAGVQPTPFQLFVAASGGTFDPAGPTVGSSTLSIGFTTTSGLGLIMEIGLDKTGPTRLIRTSGFTPTPAPPSPYSGSFGLQFEVENTLSGDFLVGVIGLRDPRTGRRISVSQGPEVTPAVVPVPPAGLALGAGIALLLTLRRRR